MWVTLVFVGLVPACLGSARLIADETCGLSGPFLPGTAVSGDVRNMAVVYMDARSLPGSNYDDDFRFDAAKFGRLVGFKPAGAAHAQDALFDGVLLVGYDWGFGRNVGRPPNASDWRAIAELWRTQGQEALANATQAVNADLDTTLPDVKLYVTIPYPDRRQQHFGDAFSTCRGDAARVLNFSVDADRLLAAECWVAHIVQDWPVLTGVAVTGFYWHLPDVPAGDEALLRGVADFIQGIPTPDGKPPLNFTRIPIKTMVAHDEYLWRTLGPIIKPGAAYNNVERDASDAGLQCNPRAGRADTFYFGFAFVGMANCNVSALADPLYCNRLYVKIHDLACGVGQLCLRFS